MSAKLRDTIESESDLNPLDEAWLMAKPVPQETGLPMAVWITPNEGYPHDVWVKVSRLHGGRGRWSDAVSIAVRPQPHEVMPGTLPADDLRAVSDWIALNRAVIVDYWDGATLTVVMRRLQRLP